MQAVIDWLESPEGERWSQRRHRLGHEYSLGPSILVSLKDDEGSFDGFIWYTR